MKLTRTDPLPRGAVYPRVHPEPDASRDIETVSLVPGSLNSMAKASWPGAHVLPPDEESNTMPTLTTGPAPKASRFETFRAALEARVQTSGGDLNSVSDRHAAMVAVLDESPELAEGLSSDDLVTATRPRHSDVPLRGKRFDPRVDAAEYALRAADALDPPRDAVADYVAFKESLQPKRVDNYSAFRAATKTSHRFTSAGVGRDASPFKPGLYNSRDIATAKALGDNVEAGERRWFDRLHEIARSQKLRLSEPTDLYAAMRHVALERIALGASVSTARCSEEAVLLYRAQNKLSFRSHDSALAEAAVVTMRPEFGNYVAPHRDEVIRCDEGQDVAALFREELAARGLADTNANRHLVADDVAARMKNSTCR